MIKIRLDEVIGLKWALQSARLSYDARPAIEVAADADYDFMADVDFADCSILSPDQELAEKLIRRGPSHAKFLRCITVYMTVAAPRYFLAQLSTYKVGVTEISQSTMHTITKRHLTREDFAETTLLDIRDSLEGLFIAHDRATDEKAREEIFRIIKANLPEGFLQARAICTNYQALRTMYHQRKNHRLIEWREFCQFLKTMPQSWMITMEGQNA